MSFSDQICISLQHGVIGTRENTFVVQPVRAEHTDRVRRDTDIRTPHIVYTHKDKRACHSDGKYMYIEIKPSGAGGGGGGGGNLGVNLVRVCEPVFRNLPHSYTWPLKKQTHSYTLSSKMLTHSYTAL